MTKEPLVREPQQQRSIEKKQRIVQAAAELFAERGFKGSNSKLIAARAGVSVGTFYNYFKNKKSLIMNVAQLHNEQLNKTVFNGLMNLDFQGKTNREIVRRIIDATYQAHDLSPEFHREALGLGLVDEQMRRYHEQFDQDVHRQVVSFLGSLGERIRVTDLEAAAQTVNMAVEGVVHSLVLFNQPLEVERVLDELTDMITRYLSKDPDNE